MLPRIVAPKAGPSLMIACISALPTPLRSTGSSTIAADAAVARAMPAPQPTTKVQAVSKASPLDTEIVLPQRSPRPRTASPVAAETRIPSLRATRSAGMAPTTMPAIAGRKRTPAP